jgi:hypothetical protein
MTVFLLFGTPSLSIKYSPFHITLSLDGRGKAKVRVKSQRESEVRSERQRDFVRV